MPNMPHKNPQYPLRIPEETMDKLKYIAAYYGRSANKEMERLVLSHISSFEKKHGIIALSEEDYDFIRKNSQWKKNK